MFSKRGSFIYCMLALLVCSALPFADAQEKEDKVVVSVDSTEITEQEVVQEIEALAQQMGGQIPANQKNKVNQMLYDQAVERLISFSLLMNVAEEKDIKIEKEDVDAKIEELKERVEEQGANFEQILAQQGMTEKALRERIREQDDLLVEKVAKTMVKEPAPPTEEEMKQFYEKQGPSFPEQVRASHIILSFPQDKELSEAEKSKMKEQLQELKKKIEAGAITFAEAARQHSQGPSSSRGGDLNFFQREQMVKPFSDAAFAAKKGEITDIVETKFGYHLIKVTDQMKTFEDYKEKIRDYLSAKMFNDAVKEYVESLKKDAKIEQHMTKKEWMARHAPDADQGNGPKIKIDPEQLKNLRNN